MEVRDVGRFIAKDVICSISIHWSEQKTEQASCDKNFMMFPGRPKRKLEHVPRWIGSGIFILAIVDFRNKIRAYSRGEMNFVS